MSDQNTGPERPDPGWEAAIARYAIGAEGDAATLPPPKNDTDARGVLALLRRAVVRYGCQDPASEDFGPYYDVMAALKEADRVLDAPGQAAPVPPLDESERR